MTNHPLARESLGSVMSEEHTLDRLLAHLHAHVAELRRLEREGADPEEVAERKRLILRLQNHMAGTLRHF